MYLYFALYKTLLVFSGLVIFLSVYIDVQILYSLLLLVVIFIFNRFRCFRVRCRAGSYGKAPSNELDMVNACKGQETVVGQSWSFFLQRKVPIKPLFTHNFTSTKPDPSGFWKSGTLLKTVSEYYERQGKAFPSLPSYQNITLGGWIMTKSHGSSGDKGRGSSSCFHEVIYVNDTNKRVTTSYSNLDIAKVKLILYVKFHLLEKDFWLLKRRVDSMEEWVSDNAYQRVCFIGSHQDVMIRWEKTSKKDNIHSDPHACSRFCLWFQADVCTTCGCRCTETSNNYQSNVKLSEVNRFVPFVFPILAAFVESYKNFEIIMEANKDQVIRYYKKAKRFHKKLGGRTEIRYGKFLFLDVSIAEQHINEYLETVASGKFHLGKFRPKVGLASADIDFKLKL